MSTTSLVPCAPHSERGWQVPHYSTQALRERTHRYAVVVPVINEGNRIQNLLTRMRTLSIAGIADIIIVDGGSTDGSLDPGVLRQADVTALLVKTGPGKLSAQLRCAYAFCLEAGYEGIVTIDGNDKDDPAPIATFILKLTEGVDFVQASRFIPGGAKENTPVARHVAIRLIHAPLLSLSSGFHWTDTTQGFRAYSRRLLCDPAIAPFREVFNTYELLAYLSYRAPRTGFKCLEVPTSRCYPAGEVPTKISSVRGNLEVLTVLFKACLGRYNPSI